MEAHMPTRKSTLTDSARSDIHNPARPAEEAALLHGRKSALKGNSETHFTRAELEQLLSLPTHESDGARTGVISSLIDAAWEHGRVMPEADASIWRQDACGAWMRREQIGRQTEFGWKIRSLSTSAEQTPDDLRPFQWRNDFEVASGHPHCAVTADHSSMPGEEQVRPPRNRET
jgi:hypothetical protein